MAYIYALSDIHGHLDIFRETLKNVDLESKNNKLILLGDYINRGDKSCETLYFIKELCEKYPGKVISLLGNHEVMFLEDLNRLYPEGEFSEIIKYILEDEYNAISKKCENVSNELTQMYMIYRYVTDLIKSKHKTLIAWLRKLPLYYETENQIFVHAGIDEEAEEYWKVGTSEEYFTWKYPPAFGTFYKDIIAGHTHTSEIAKDKNFHSVYWDKKSHFYIDGATVISKFIPLLKYDITAKEYSTFEKVIQDDDSFVWREYAIK